MMKRLISLLRTWKLPVSMLTGVLLYYLLKAMLPAGGDAEGIFYHAVSHFLQPSLIFVMLLLSFLRVDIRDLKPHRWHIILLAVQSALFVLSSVVALLIPPSAGGWRLMAEGAMLCFICPTATASAVIVQKLGGSVSGDVTYIVLCNMMVSLLAPAFLTLVEPHAGLGFMTEFFMIMGKVFPLLLFPLFIAFVIRHYAPRLRDGLLSVPDLAFYLWLVALALAITVTVRTIAESDIALVHLVGLAVVSALCCVVQFRVGRCVGRRWKQPTKPLAELSISALSPNGYIDAAERSSITAGQAMGQKNTVFAIWMGLVFLNPVTSVVGGFYSIWHNLINSWQLYQRSKAAAK